MSEVIVIAGPTASGKSAVALSLAKDIGGEIVNADAMQVYADLRILTARPSKAEEDAVPHHLYGVSPGDDPWSAGRFARAAADSIEQIIGKGRRAIVVGGTGLWLKALTEGLSPMPFIADEVMQSATEQLAALGMDAFRAEVLAKDPVMTRLEPQDRQRHLRAWAVAEATGKPLSIWQEALPMPVTKRSFRRVALIPLRELSHQSVQKRLGEMLEDGALDEVEQLMACVYPSNVPIMKAVGVPEFGGYLRGDTSLEDATERAVIATRQLVKRQTTWLNGQFADWVKAEDAESLLRLINS